MHGARHGGKAGLVHDRLEVRPNQAVAPVGQLLQGTGVDVVRQRCQKPVENIEAVRGGRDAWRPVPRSGLVLVGTPVGSACWAGFGGCGTTATYVPISISWSKRPGRRSAGSKAPGRFVAASTSTGAVSAMSRPSLR